MITDFFLIKKYYTFRYKLILWKLFENDKILGMLYENEN
jgi:hypothetical protein